jgi:hypothetical protein
MTHQACLIHRHVSRSGRRQAKADADPPTSPRAVGERRWSAKVAHLTASHYWFALSGNPQDNGLANDGTGDHLACAGCRRAPIWSLGCVAPPAGRASGACSSPCSAPVATG